MWDCEIYALPFLTFTWPEAARRMLMYRHATLGEARAKAARLGFAGALYAWESAATGAEVTPRYATTRDGERTPIRTGDAAHHVSADVAYAVWQYWCATGDEPFLRDAGAEILVGRAGPRSSRGPAPRGGRRCAARAGSATDELDSGDATTILAREHPNAAGARGG